MQAPCCLYRFYNEAGELLYVGISLNPLKRFLNHKTTSAMWTEVRMILLEPCESRGEAIIKEQEIIKAEQPIWNQTHKSRWNRSLLNAEERAYVRRVYNEVKTIRATSDRLFAEGYMTSGGRPLSHSTIHTYLKEGKESDGIQIGETEASIEDVFIARDHASQVLRSA